VYYDQDGNRNFGRFYNYRQFSTDLSTSWTYWTSYLKVSFRAVNGQYVCAEGGGTPGQALVVNRDGYGAWETFLMQPNDNWSDQTINHGEVFSLIASHPTYVYAEGGGGEAVYATAPMRAGGSTSPSSKSTAPDRFRMATRSAS
jgi:hypothetical protein